MYCDNFQIYIESDDQCETCEFYKIKIACPLLEALGQGVVYLESETHVKNCGFYKKHERILRRVK